MKLFGSKSDEPLDPELARSLRPDDKHTRDKLAKVQEAIRGELMPGEQAKVISFGGFGSAGFAVATDRRFLVFYDRLGHEVSQPGITVEMNPSGSSTVVRVHHRTIYLDQATRRVSQPDDFVSYYFKNASDAAALCAAIDTMSDSADAPGLFIDPAEGDPNLDPNSPSLSDAEWLQRSQWRYSRSVDPYYGSVDKMASGARNRYDNKDFGTALFFFGKSIDMLHTCYSHLKNRLPSSDDSWIVRGYVDTVVEVLALHPQAPVGESVREAAKYIWGIANICDNEGRSPELYRETLAALKKAAPGEDLGDFG
jgi:hypothetical protein